MTPKTKFFFTDVFGETRYSGNQLATFVDCAGLTDVEMQHIAREVNFSETTFVLSDEKKDGGFDVRIFTPRAELDFAGHPTLGTAYIIWQHLAERHADTIVLNLPVGQVPVTLPRNDAGGPLWMRQKEPIFAKILDAGRVARVLGLDEPDIDTRWPVQEVSTGLPQIIVPLKTREALRRIKVSSDGYEQLTQDAWAKVILAFCPEGYATGQKLGVRVFPICFGIHEDPATGSGNGCLAAYLVKHRYFGSGSIDISTGQGYEIGRPSVLFLRAQECAGQILLDVGGKVFPIAEGWWG